MLGIQKKLKKVSFIIDPTAGFNRRPGHILRMIEELWGSSGVDYDILKTAHQGHGAELAQDAVASGVDMVVAAGDDAMIAGIARGLIGSETALGIIPAGAANGFARNLGIPLNQKQAIAVLQNPVFSLLDMGRIDKEYFLNVAGSGLGAEVAMRYGQSDMHSVGSYFWRAMRQFLRYRPQKVTLQFDGKYIEREPLMVTIANLPEYGNNVIIAPEARADDGLLDICVVNQLPAWKAFVNLPRLFNGTIGAIPEVELFRARRVILHREQESMLHADGHFCYAGATVTAEVLPEKLKVAVPA